LLITLLLDDGLAEIDFLGGQLPKLIVFCFISLPFPVVGAYLVYTQVLRVSLDLMGVSLFELMLGFFFFITIVNLQLLLLI
jgi:hypothetical protein